MPYKRLLHLAPRNSSLCINSVPNAFGTRLKHPRHDNHLWNVTLLRCSVLWCCRSSIPLSTYIAYLCFRQAKWMCTSQPTGCKLPFRPRLFSAHFTVSIISLPPLPYFPFRYLIQTLSLKKKVSSAIRKIASLTFLCLCTAGRGSKERAI